MRVCASLSNISDLDLSGRADMVEVRLDLLGKVPDTRGKETVVTFRGPVDLGVLPEGYSGIIDIGEEPRPETEATVLASYHDYEATPDAEWIVSKLNGMDADIRKGAFRVNSLKDLVSLHRASQSIEGRHVLLGMGALGAVTRIRPSALGSEFSFGYIEEPTAPGQFSVDEMSELTDDCMVLGILGNPLSKSRSPAMQNAALKAAGIRGMYIPFETPDLEGIEDVVRDYGIRGMNVTIPHKQSIMDHLDTIDRDAEKVGAVNTIVNDNGTLKGYNTDVAGISKALDVAGIDPTERRVLIMGYGGAARACAHYMDSIGCRITVTGRNAGKGTALAKEFGAVYRHPDSVSLRMHDLIVNCTPIGMYSDDPYPINIEYIDHSQAVFDMVYGKETPIVAEARRKGCRVAVGADMLAGQGDASFRLWTGVRDSFDVMRRQLE